MFRYLLLVIFVFFLPIQAYAQTEKANFCHNISKDDLRLSCYDKITSYSPSKSENKIENNSSKENSENNSPKDKFKWKVVSRKSPIDDSENVYLILESDSPIRGRFGSPGPMVLNIHCRENTTMLYISFNGLFMSDLNHGTVTYRLDSEEAKTKSMIESNDHSALGLWNGGSSIPFIKNMFGHDKILIQATPMSESAFLATFSISNLEKAIEPLRKSCGW